MSPTAVRGLDLGATDYLGKPFAFAELLARIRARTRRPAQNGQPASSLSVGPVTLDLLAREADSTAAASSSRPASSRSSRISCGIRARCCRDSRS